MYKRQHQIDPTRVLEALRIAFQNTGGSLRTHTNVDEIATDGPQRIGAVVNEGETLWGRALVVAAGAWSSQLVSGLETPPLAVRPVRGQMLSIDAGDPPLCRHIIRTPDAYLVPKSDGRLLIGATMEEVGFDDQPTAGGVFEPLRGAGEALPVIYEQAILDIWCGHRPISHDNRPVVRRSDIDGLWFATGHGRNGYLLAPQTAHVVAESLGKEFGWKSADK